MFLSQNVVERILGAGDLSVESASEQGRQTFEDVRDPIHFQTVVYQARDSFLDRVRTLSGNAIGEAVARNIKPHAAGALDEIERAHRLYVDGVISQNEFDHLKERLLGQ